MFDEAKIGEATGNLNSLGTHLIQIPFFRHDEHIGSAWLTLHESKELRKKLKKLERRIKVASSNRISGA